MVQRSRARGIVRGTGTGELEFEFVVRGDDVQAGDVVITSGVGGVYPKGLRIGAVVEVAGRRRRSCCTRATRASPPSTSAGSSRCS